MVSGAHERDLSFWQETLEFVGVQSPSFYLKPSFLASKMHTRPAPLRAASVQTTQPAPLSANPEADNYLIHLLPLPCARTVTVVGNAPNSASVGSAYRPQQAHQVLSSAAPKRGTVGVGSTLTLGNKSWTGV